MEIKHLSTARGFQTLPVLEVVPLPGESFEQAVVRTKKAQQQELETVQETKCND
jgi:hypothetical protein